MLVLNNIQGEVCFFTIALLFRKKQRSCEERSLKSSFLHSSLNFVSDVLYSAYSHKLHNFNKLFSSIIGGHNFAFCYDTTDRFAFMN